MPNEPIARMRDSEMARIFGIRHRPVVLPAWFPALRAVQLFFAMLIIGLTAYSLSAHNTSQIHPALVLTITTAVLTVVPIFPFTLPLSKAVVHPLRTLLSDFLGTLLWLASLVALASYLRIYKYYRKVENIPWAPGAPNIVRAWRCGVAACVFAAIELLLFLATLKLFAYFYHHHRAGTQPHVSLLPSSGCAPRDESFSLQNGLSAGALATTETDFAQQQPAHQQLQASNISPPLSHTRPSAPPVYNVPSITTTAATPTVPTITRHERTNAGTIDAFAATYEPGHGTGYTSPIIPDPETAAAKATEKARPPCPVDEDERRGIVGKGRNGAVPAALVSGVSSR